MGLPAPCCQTWDQRALPTVYYIQVSDVQVYFCANQTALSHNSINIHATVHKKYYKNISSYNTKSRSTVSNNNTARRIATSQQLHFLLIEWRNLGNLMEHTTKLHIQTASNVCDKQTWCTK